MTRLTGRLLLLLLLLGALQERFVHLTNSAVQKQRVKLGLAPGFLKGLQPNGGAKCSLADLEQLLQQAGTSLASLWPRIVEVVQVALFAAQDEIPNAVSPCCVVASQRTRPPHLLLPPSSFYCCGLSVWLCLTLCGAHAQVNSFELFGFDVLIDEALKVWLIEVNSSPSMSLDTPLDNAIKPQLIRDVIGLVDPPAFDRQALLAALKARHAPGGQSKRLSRKGFMAGTAEDERQQASADLAAVLGGRLPRELGQKPEAVGGFECIAPSPTIDKLMKLRKPT